ncbi:MAG: DUF4465 domain-containing protein [Saprospiraceae bacterium]
MKLSLVLLFSLLQLGLFSQVVATFENFNLARGAHLNDASPAEGFESGSIHLPNDYNADFDFWSGFAISADTNTTTPGYLNQYSAIPGSGALGTTAYAVGYIFDPEFIYPIEKAAGKPVIGMYVTNSTYAYLSMRDGDAFAKKFGGETGKDPDFFLLTIKKYSGGAISDDSINFYLADYRPADSSKDYIISDWRYVDLTTLGEVDSLVMSLTSSDVGIFGMNTPAYACFDQISTDNLLSASSLYNPGNEISIGPNPVNETLHMYIPVKGECSISNIQGIKLWSEKLEEGHHQISVTNFPSGLYFVMCEGRIAAKFFVE